MRVTLELAERTPACACGGYIDAGERLDTVDGVCGTAPAWWVACPDCGRALGPARRYPIRQALRALTGAHR
jgi:hypothetical protein